MTTPPSMLDIARAIEAVETAHPEFRWLTAPETPNGRYHVAPNAPTVYVDGRQSVTEGFTALLEAIDLLLGHGDNVVPFRRPNDHDPPDTTQRRNRG